MLNVCQFGLTLGALGLVLTGAATTIGMAIAGSAIFGFSSASAYILSAVVSEILPRRQRGLVQALFNLCVQPPRLLRFMELI